MKRRERQSRFGRIKESTDSIENGRGRNEKKAKALTYFVMIPIDEKDYLGA